MMNKRSLITAIVVASIMVMEFACSSLENDPKYKEMQQLYSTLPVYPDSEEVDYYGGSKGNLAYFGKYYKADFRYEGLKQFYLERMPASGWNFVNEEKASTSWFRDDGGKRLNFHNGQYKVSVEHATKERNIGWDYTIHTEWRPQ